MTTPMPVAAETAVFDGLMQQSLAPSATICSVHFYSFTKEMPHAKIRIVEGKRVIGGFTNYVLPAVEGGRTGKYSTCVVNQAWQLIPRADPSGDAPSELIPMPWHPHVVAHDLVDCWRSSFMAVGRRVPPGIGVIAGTEPTKEEYAALVAQQEALCIAAIEHADWVHLNKPAGESILPFHRKAAEWMNIEGRPWQSDLRAQRTKTGIISNTAIPETALADAGIFLPKYYFDNGIDPATIGDTYIASHPAYLKLIGGNAEEKPFELPARKK